mmetsp:Transcript_16340/g.42422  ORF Transcript_16340/g.42422 Transcript_16340/m.42422 type:complete len:315 (-) Transcript_16340:2340-3284(-)
MLGTRVRKWGDKGAGWKVAATRLRCCGTRLRLVRKKIWASPSPRHRGGLHTDEAAERAFQVAAGVDQSRLVQLAVGKAHLHQLFRRDGRFGLVLDQPGPLDRLLPRDHPLNHRRRHQHRRGKVHRRRVGDLLQDGRHRIFRLCDGLRQRVGVGAGIGVGVPSGCVGRGGRGVGGRRLAVLVGDDDHLGRVGRWSRRRRGLPAVDHTIGTIGANVTVVGTAGSGDRLIGGSAKYAGVQRRGCGCGGLVRWRARRGVGLRGFFGGGCGRRCFGVGINHHKVLNARHRRVGAVRVRTVPRRRGGGGSMLLLTEGIAG